LTHSYAFLTSALPTHLAHRLCIPLAENRNATLISSLIGGLSLCCHEVTCTSTSLYSVVANFHSFHNPNPHLDPIICRNPQQLPVRMSFSGPTRGPSPVPRVSTSSARSRKTAEDFEAALLHPTQTIFLSGSVTHDTPISSVPDDHDAPIPIGKRSFEEDYEYNLRAGATPTKGGGMEVTPPTPTTVASTSTVPANTSNSVYSGSSVRRPSQATQSSLGSAGSTPTRVLAKGKAMGIDGQPCLSSPFALSFPVLGQGFLYG
jgi:hypothetical protein